MAFKEDEMKNYNVVGSIKEEVLTEVKQEFDPDSNNTSKAILPSHSSSEENYIVNKDIEGNCAVKKDAKCYNFFTGDRNTEEIDDTNEIIANRNKDETQYLSNQPGGSLKTNTLLKTEEKTCLFIGESSSSDQSHGLKPDTFQTSTQRESSIGVESTSSSEESSSAKVDIASPSAPSKQKLRNTKRRAGVLYKQITSSKVYKVTSKYFDQCHNINQKRWIPPRSPYALVQEDLFDNPWQLLVATIFLTKTSAKKAIPQLHKFLACYPRPQDVLQANYEDIDEYFKPLGLTTTRSHIIMRFTVEFLEKEWTYPRELYGIGKYGDDSYRIFCINEWRQVSPDDIPLTMYRNWLLENADRLGV